LIVRYRVWTANRLAKRGLPHNEKCIFCNAAEEDPQHLFMGCAVINITWSSILTWAGLAQVIPLNNPNLRFWWNQAASNLQNKSKKKLNTMVILVIWTIWKERNGRVFENKVRTLLQILDQIKSEARLWVLASRGRFILQEAGRCVVLS
jgi:hypothetical protein